MTIYFSADEGGFFTESVHGSSLPDDAVEITAEQYLGLLSGQAVGLRIASGSGGLPVLLDAPLDELRQRKFQEIDRARDAAISGGFEFNGVVFDSDRTSVQRINGAVTLSLLNPAYETQWITYDNSVVTLDAAGLAGLGAAAGAHEAQQIFKARALKDQVLAATTPEEIAVINW